MDADEGLRQRRGRGALLRRLRHVHGAPLRRLRRDGRSLVQTRTRTLALALVLALALALALALTLTLALALALTLTLTFTLTFTLTRYSAERGKVPSSWSDERASAYLLERLGLVRVSCPYPYP